MNQFRDAGLNFGYRWERLLLISWVITEIGRGVRGRIAESVE